jgi:hypothetical protein
MRKYIGMFSAIGLSALLAACGGGSSVPSAEGAWAGTDSWGSTFNKLVLENGDIYSLYGVVKSGVFNVQGFEQGRSTLTGDKLNASITEYSRNPPITGTLTATLVTDKSLTGTISNTAGTASGTFSATPLSKKYASYDYNTKAVLSDVAGSWSGNVLDGSAATVTISAAGAITGSSQGCNFTGTTMPRSSGKNVFNINLSFASIAGASPCPIAGTSVAGIALDYDMGNGKRQLLAAMQDSGKKLGYLFFAQR